MVKTLLGIAAACVDGWASIRYFPGGLGAVRFFGLKSSKSVAEKVLLYSIARELAVDGDILEIGSFAGASAALLAAGNKASARRGIVWLVEPQPRPSAGAFIGFFRERKLDTEIRLVEKTSEDARRTIDPRCRFIFVDGNHAYDFVRKDIVLWQDTLREGGVIAFHDIEMEGVSKAVDELITRSGKFTILGSVGATFYAVKGGVADKDLMDRFGKLHDIRRRCIGISRRLELKKRCVV